MSRFAKPADAQANSACLSYDHSFGLMNEEDGETLQWQDREWLHAWRKEEIQIHMRSNRMDNFAAMAPFSYAAGLQKVVGTNAKIGGMNPVIDIRSWGYLTGGGHGALGLDRKEAASEQDAFGELVAELLNKHFMEDS